MCYGSWSGFSGRRYYTKEEKSDWLREYADNLENELKAVKERIGELKAE